MITASEFLKWLAVFDIPYGGGGSGGVTELEVQRSAFNFVVGTGSDDHFVANLTPAVTVLTDGLLITMTTSFTNLTETPMLKVNGLAELPIVTTLGESLIPSDISANVAYLFAYNLLNNNFQIINPSLSIASSYLVQKNFYNYTIDIGDPNDYVGNLLVKPLAVSGGLSIILQIGNTNTGASTLTLNSLAPVAIVGISGGKLVGGEIIGGSIAELIYSDNYNAYILLNSAIIPGAGTVGSGSINNLAWYAANGNTISSLATATNGLLVTSASGEPSIGNSIGADIIVNGVNVGQGPFIDAPFYSNLALGRGALGNNVSGSSNTAVGRSSLESLASGNFNTSVGDLSSVTNNGLGNCTFGFSSAIYLGTTNAGNNNTILGTNTGVGVGGPFGVDMLEGDDNTWIGESITGSAIAMFGTIGIGRWATPDPATGLTAADSGPSIAIGETTYNVGFRGDGSAYPAGAANYWRMKVNGTYYKIPILPDSTSISWPATGTLATTSTASGIVNAGLINQLAYYAAAGNAVSGLATFNAGILSTNLNGVPAISRTVYADLEINTLAVGQGPGTQTGERVCFGQNALISNVTGDFIAAIGFAALSSNTSGMNLTAVGNTSLASNTTGTDSVAVGYQSLVTNTTGNYLTAVGSGALYANDTSNNSSAFGYASLSVNDGNDNSAFGYACANGLGISSNGIQNSFFGSSVGIATVGGQAILQGGDNNTWFGYAVSGNQITVSGTIGIGSYATPAAATGSTTVTFGPDIAIGSTTVPVGFRGDGTSFPAGSANYWRMKVNGTYYKIPILPDATDIQWPATGTLATTSVGQQWINVTAATTTIVPGSWYVANYTGGTTVFELPVLAAFGTEFRIKMGLAGSDFQITQGAGQQIKVALGSSTVGVTGYAQSTGPTDYLSLTCLDTDLIFGNTGFDGNISLN